MDNDFQQKVMFSLGQIQESVAGIKEHLAVSNGRLSKHDEAIDDLKNWRSNMVGKISIIVIGIGAIVTIATNFIFNSIKFKK